MYTNKTAIGIIGISHTYKSIIKALKKYNYKIIICDIDNNKMLNEPYEKYNDYHDLLSIVDMVYVATPPSTHFEISSFFLKNNIKVLCEKPLVTNKKDLDILNSYNNLYNVLHFSYGEEIEWFINNNLKEKPNKIICTINDPYILNKSIKEDKLSLHGSYLDETINPLSALRRIYNKNLTFIKCNKYFYRDDIYDYKSDSMFKLDDIDIEVHTNWNEQNNKEKYVDLYFTDKTIRLDSVNVKVINLTNNNVLFESNNNRMDMHYINALKDITNNKEVYDNLNNVILDGEHNAKNYIY